MHAHTHHLHDRLFLHALQTILLASLLNGGGDAAMVVANPQGLNPFGNILMDEHICLSGAALTNANVALMIYNT